jgi:hypothetical protein
MTDSKNALPDTVVVRQSDKAVVGDKVLINAFPGHPPQVGIVIGYEVAIEYADDEEDLREILVCKAEDFELRGALMSQALNLYPVEGSERDIFEVANQLGGYVDPGTEKNLARFLIREAEEASKLAYELVRLRAELAPPQLDASDFQLLERLKRENVAGEPRHVVEGNQELWKQARRLSDEGLIAIEQHALGGILHVTSRGMNMLASIRNA